MNLTVQRLQRLHGGRGGGRRAGGQKRDSQRQPRQTRPGSNKCVAPRSIVAGREGCSWLSFSRSSQVTVVVELSN